MIPQGRKMKTMTCYHQRKPSPKNSHVLWFPQTVVFVVVAKTYISSLQQLFCSSQMILTKSDSDCINCFGLNYVLSLMVVVRRANVVVVVVVVIVVVVVVVVVVVDVVMILVQVHATDVV